MFGKHFAQMYTGSMAGAGLHVFAVWGYVVGNTTREGTVEINPEYLGRVLGGTADDVKAAVEYLCAPDPESRSQDEAGRRLVMEAPNLYRVVNYERYRSIRNAEALREYNRDRQRAYRARQRETKVVADGDLTQPVAPVTPPVTMSLRDESVTPRHTPMSRQAEDRGQKTEDRQQYVGSEGLDAQHDGHDTSHRDSGNGTDSERVKALKAGLLQVEPEALVWLKQLTKASPNPNAFVLEVCALMEGLRGQAPSYRVLALALADMATNGQKPTAAVFRAYVRRAADDLDRAAHPTKTGVARLRELASGSTE